MEPQLGYGDGAERGEGMKELLLGCGHRRDKDIITPNGKEWHDLTTLDYYEDAKADVMFDLCSLNHREHGRLPFDTNTFDEVHAYDVLEHINWQGDFEAMFYEFGEYYRVLKPDGLFCATVPLSINSIHTWGDPGHRRVINDLTLVYFSHKSVMEQLGKTTLTDYLRYLGNTELQTVHYKEGQDRIAFVLRAVKPA